MEEDISPLLRHLSSAAALEHDQARHIVEEVLAYFTESVEAFVLRRHQELSSAGLRNAAIYQQISQELSGRLFAATPLSIRQIRRLIYG
jgi:hypothetical protein